MKTLIQDKTVGRVATAQLALCVLQPGVEEKTFPLPRGKCTIGSSPNCLIQLVGSEVRPLHCLVVHDERETVVTRWASGVLLNGQEFASSTIGLGDCLQIGEVQLCVVAEDRFEPFVSDAKPEKPDQFSQAEPTPQTAERELSLPTPNFCVTSQWFADRLVTKLWTANYQARHRCRGLVSSLRDLRAEVGETDQQIYSLKEELRQALEERDRICRELAQSHIEATEQELLAADEMGRLIEELNSSNDEKGKKEAFLAVQVAEERIADQVAKCERLQVELERSQSEREQLADLCQSYEQGEQDWKQMLADRDQQIGDLHREMQQAHSEILASEERGTGQTAECESLHRELTQLLEERVQLVAKRSEYEARQQEWEQTLAKRDCQIQDLHRALNEIQTQRDEFISGQPEHEQRQAELQHSLEERDREIVDLTEQVAVATRERSELETVIASHGDATRILETEAERLRSHCDSLSAENTANGGRENELQQAVAERQQRVELLEVDLQGVRAELEQVAGQVSQLEVARLTAEELLAEARQTVDAKVESACDDKAVNEAITRLQEQAAWTEQAEEGAEQRQQVEPEPAAKEFQPTSFIEQYSSMLDEGGKAEIEPVTPIPATPVAPEESSLGDPTDDGALEDYMANMLQRMRGESDAKDEARQFSPSVAIDESGAAEEALAEPIEAEPVVVEGPIGLVELGQTSLKPELPTDMAAMRELANSSARHAIAKHHKKRYQESVAGQIAICVTSLAVAVYLLMADEGYQSTSFIAGCIAATVSLVWVTRLVRNSLSAIRAGSDSERTPTEISVKDGR